MNRFALCALLASTAMLTACGAGAGSASSALPAGANANAASSPQGQITALDATGAPLTSISFSSTAPGTVRTFTVVDMNFGGAFTESDTCSKIATVTAVSNAVGNAVYKVSPTAAGSCTITISGGGAQINISVGVTAVPITVS